MQVELSNAIYYNIQKAVIINLLRLCHALEIEQKLQCIIYNIDCIHKNQIFCKNIYILMSIFYMMLPSIIFINSLICQIFIYTFYMFLHLMYSSQHLTWINWVGNLKVKLFWGSLISKQTKIRYFLWHKMKMKIFCWFWMS